MSTTLTKRRTAALALLETITFLLVFFFLTHWSFQTYLDKKTVVETPVACAARRGVVLRRLMYLTKTHQILGYYYCLVFRFSCELDTKTELI